MGLSEMNVKSLRRQVNGSGTMRAQKMSISVTKRRKTWKKNKSKHVGDIGRLARGNKEDTRALCHEVTPLERVSTTPAAN